MTTETALRELLTFVAAHAAGLPDDEAACRLTATALRACGELRRLRAIEHAADDYLAALSVLGPIGPAEKPLHDALARPVPK